MPLDLEDITKLVSSLDPQRPLDGGDPDYVQLDTARGEQACVDRLFRVILTRGEDSCQLFTGFPGTGKTTELKQLQKKIDEAPSPRGGYVLYIRFEDYVDLFRPISIIDVLRVLAFCVSEEADRIEQTSTPPGETYLRAFFEKVTNWLPKDVQLKSAGFDIYGVKLMAELKSNPDIYAQVDAAIRSRFQSFVGECHKVVADGIARIRRMRGDRAKRFVIIADGLENLRAAGNSKEEQDTIDAAVKRLFVEDSEYLRTPCHVIYTFPVSLRFRTAQLGALYGGEPLTLPMVKLHARPNAEAEGEADAGDGVQLLTRLLLKRLGSFAEAVLGESPADALLPIVEASGGYPRDALRLLRELLQYELDFPITAAAIGREIKRLRRQYQDLVLAADREILLHVRDTHEMPSEDADQRSAFGRLFANFLIFAYRNGEEWFDLHPLIRDAKALRPRPGDGAR